MFVSGEVCIGTTIRSNVAPCISVHHIKISVYLTITQQGKNDEDETLHQESEQLGSDLFK